MRTPSLCHCENATRHSWQSRSGVSRVPSLSSRGSKARSLKDPAVPFLERCLLRQRDCHAALAMTERRGWREGDVRAPAYPVCHREERSLIFDKSGDLVAVGRSVTSTRLPRFARNDRVRNVGTREGCTPAGFPSRIKYGVALFRAIDGKCQQTLDVSVRYG